MRTLVVQSHRDPLPAAWLEPCCASVRRWALVQGFDYRWLGDELLAGLDDRLAGKTRCQSVVAADLGRLQVLQSALDEGRAQVVWVDADVLVLDPDRFRLADAGAQFGREVWVQRGSGNALKVYRKIHNAVMAFRRGDPVLPFYRFAAERILSEYEGPPERMVAQLVGPKLLTLLHNAIGFDVLEPAAVLSPLVVQDVLSGGGPALERFRSASAVRPLAANLCASSVRRGELDDADMMRLVSCLQRDPDLLSV